MSCEREIRAMLEAKATLAPSPRPRPVVLRAARERRLRVLGGAASVTAAMLAAIAVAAPALDGSNRAYAALRLVTTPSTEESNRERSATPGHRHAVAGKPVTRAMVERNVDCMRAQGFALPDPQQTANGWEVIVEDSEPLPSESPDVGVRKRWAEAVFVNCRLLDASGDLVLGGRTSAQIDRLMSCTRARGFVLPQPVEANPGEFVFRLADASPRWGSDAWYRTVFVTCGLWQAAE